ncbi:hypothetical protein KP509_12G083200 [Ceratopteris richardii]|uniref:Uncharacterized protein n=1 Tax=Ceratopteris richardii TaxID=49495 RepID=A0A8T2TKV5_CERRI|nr:hypothetical protein KP509_12G083200 [Ceratopteris richardii]
MELILQMGMSYYFLIWSDTNTFVDEVLVQNQVWISGRPERLSGIHIFVCSHVSHDIRCGVSGPVIIGSLRNELRVRGLDADVFIRPCTHIGGHKYRANVILYSMEFKCYASVTADDVCQLVDELISMGVLSGHLRGFEGRLDMRSFLCAHGSNQNLLEGNINLQLPEVAERYADLRSINPPRPSFSDKGDDVRVRQPGHFSVHSWWQPSWWLKCWEREDTWAAFAVIGAAASVYVAYQLYRIHGRH